MWYWIVANLAIKIIEIIAEKTDTKTDDKIIKKIGDLYDTIKPDNGRSREE